MKSTTTGPFPSASDNGNEASNPWQGEDSIGDGPNERALAGFADNFVVTAENRLPDSDEYIHSLEKKLARVQGKSKESTGKDLVNSISKTREDIMSRLLANDADNGASGIEEIGEDIDQTSAVAFLERKLFPERQALNAEELQRLLEQDKLTAQTEEKSSDDNKPPTSSAE